MSRLSSGGAQIHNKGVLNMGLIKAALGAAGGVMADQWMEYFYCESIPVDVLVR